MRDIFDDISKNQPFDPDGVGAPGRPAEPAQALLRERRSGRGGRGLCRGTRRQAGADSGAAATGRAGAALAEALAAEWDAQAEVIDPARMPLTRLANSIIDGVASGRDR